MFLHFGLIIAGWFCLLAALHKKIWMNFYEIFGSDDPWYKKQSIRFLG